MWEDAVIPEKIRILLRFVKDYGVKDPVTLGVVFSIFNEMEVIEKAVFLHDLNFMSGEPLLVIGYDELIAPTRFTYQELGWINSNEIFKSLFRFDPYYIYIDFPEKRFPRWYMQISEPKPHKETANPAVTPIGRLETDNATFRYVYREAHMVLINSALELGNKKHFIALSEKLKSINLMK